MENFSWYDEIALALILILGLKGVINGLIKELAGLIGVVGGIFFATRYGELVGEFIDLNIYAFENKSALFLVGFMVFLVIFWIICIIIGQILSKALSISGLGSIDKILGFFVGSAKIFLILAIFLAAISRVDFVQQKIADFMQKSILYPILIESGDYLININPNDILPKTTPQNSGVQTPTPQVIQPPQEAIEQSSELSTKE